MSHPDPMYDQEILLPDLLCTECGSPLAIDEITDAIDMGCKPQDLLCADCSNDKHDNMLDEHDTVTTYGLWKGTYDA